MMARFEITKESMIIADALNDFRFKQIFYSKACGFGYVARDASSEQVKQLSHFAKQGVKVRLK